jgi:hypothetical protein
MPHKKPKLMAETGDNFGLPHREPVVLPFLQFLFQPIIALFLILFCQTIPLPSSMGEKGYRTMASRKAAITSASDFLLLAEQCVTLRFIFGIGKNHMNRGGLC